MLSELFSKAIGLENKGDFNIVDGLNYSERLKLEFLPSQADKIKYLQETYGADNVGVLDFRGKPTTFYRDPKDDKFRLVDEYRTTFADFTADLASEAIPLAVSTVAVAAAPFTGGTSLAALLGTGGLSASLYVGAKGVQDAVGRNVAGLDVDGGEIFNRRLTEFMIQAPIDVATLRAGSFVKGVLPRGSKDAVINQVESLGRIEGVNIPRQMTTDRMGTRVRIDRPELLRQQAEKEPSSNIAKLFKENVTTVGDKAFNLFKVDSVDDTLNKYSEFLNKTKNDYNRIVNKLDEVRKDTKKLTLAEKQNISFEKKSIKSKIEEGIEKDLQVKADRLNAADDLGLSTAASGKFIQDKIFSNLHKLERQRKSLYEQAGSLMEGVPITTNELNDALNKAFINIKDFKNFDFISDRGTRNILSKFRPVKMKEGLLTSMEKLDEFGGVKNISFDELDSLIKAVNNNIVYTPTGVNLSDATQSALVSIKNQLDDLRDRKILEGGKQAKRAFNKADNFYRTKILPFRESYDSDIRLRSGQNRNEIFDKLDSFDSGKRTTVPRVDFLKEGDIFLNQTLSSTGRLKSYLDATNNDLDVKKLLRKKWMETKNLDANGGVFKFSLNKKDKEIIEILWNKNKIKDFETIAKQVQKKNKTVEFQTNRLFREMEKVETGKTQKELAVLVDKEAALESELRVFNSELLKLVVKGDVPPPNDISGFSKILLNRKNQEQTVKDLYDAVGGIDSLNAKLFQESTFEQLLKKSRTGKIDSIPEGKHGILWDSSKMRTLLENKEDYLRAVWGNTKYDEFALYNEGIARFGIQKLSRKERSQMRIGTALSGNGNISLFITAIPSWISSKLASTLWGAGAYSFKKPVTSALKGITFAPEIFLKLIGGNIKTALAGANGIGSLLLSGENDPLFDDYIKNQYMKFIKESELEDIVVEEDIAAMQPQMPQEAPQEPAMAAPMQ